MRSALSSVIGWIVMLVLAIVVLFVLFSIINGKGNFVLDTVSNLLLGARGALFDANIPS